MAIVRLRAAELDFFLNEPPGAVGRWLRRRGQLIVMAAKARVGRRSGRLMNSIHMRHYRRGPGQELKIGSPLGYALRHHEGTRPHQIVGKGQHLRFAAGGRIVYTRSVSHPGTRANHYLTDALRLIL
jgi:hypothetical protein